MNKVLFLPHCLKHSQKEFIKDYFSKRDYDIYYVGGGSKVKKIIQEYDFNSLDKVIGIACRDEINLMNEYVDKQGFDKSKIFSIPLMKNGCENTEVDLMDLFNLINTF